VAPFQGRATRASAAAIATRSAPPAASAAVPLPEVDALLAKLDDLCRSKSSIARLEIPAVSPRNSRSMPLSGLFVCAEYHDLGFEAKRAKDLVPIVTDPQNSDFRKRLQRGDTQILGQHALAVLGSYEFSPELAVAAQWLESRVDGSGMLALSATVIFGDKLSVARTAHLPYGPSPPGPDAP
jgi:hypothetical protein